MKRVLCAILFVFTCFVQANELEHIDKIFDEKKFEEAFKLYNEACTKGNSEACFKVGFMHENKQATKQDFVKAYEFYDKACSLGDARACYKMGACYEQECKVEVEQDYTKAVTYYEKSCNAQYALSCYNLGGIYQWGMGKVEKQLDKAIASFEKACQIGNIYGCYKAGNLHSQNKSLEIAKKWYRIGCNAKDMQACYRLTDIVVKQIALDIDPKDYKQFFKTFDDGCNKNKDATMCYNLGVFYSTGRGTKQDYIKAKEAFEKGCDLGDNANCMEFAALYDMGF